MKNIKKRFERVDVQVSLLTCIIVVLSCMIMFSVTFRIMRSMVIKVYNSNTAIMSDMITPYLADSLFEEDADETVKGEAEEALKRIQKEMPASDIVVYRKKKDGSFERVLAVESEFLQNDENDTGDSVLNNILAGLEMNNHAGNGTFCKHNNHFHYINAYPVYGKSMRTIGAIAIACEAEDMYEAETVLSILFCLIIILSCIIAIKFARIIFRRISNPLYQDTANTDSLTGLKNKNSYTVDLHNIERSGSIGYSVISVDMNGLKMINDTLGHQTGDLYLQRAAAVIRQATENHNAACYRIGGDEFIVILKDKTTEQLEAIASLIDHLTEKDNDEKKGKKLSLSVGFAQFDPMQDKYFSMTVERSDKIMYENKRQYYLNNNMTPR